MSDFDKEAEREKLREKYEQDQQKREATEQMSELLLQGATMTNAHCSDCGDPIFRYDGQEFCPTCEKAVEREGGDEADQQSVELTQPSDTPVAFGGASDDPQGEAGADSQQAGTQQDQARTEPRDTRAQPRRSQPRQQASDVDGGVPAARDALVETLVRFSQQAAATEDPRRARDNLEAAREAAAAISALDR